MRILLIGDEPRSNEMCDKLNAAQSNTMQTLSWTRLNEFHYEKVKSLLPQHDLVIDLLFDSYPESIDVYNHSSLLGKPVLVSAVWHSLAAAIANYSTGPLHCRLIGINALPTFIQRPLWEVSLPNSSPDQQQFVQNLLDTLHLPYRLVDDRVGMVTPRVVCMIINEAYFLLQEKGATFTDIDTALKLGVNYPNGPFEWAKKIGLEYVIKTLESVYNDTQDERYKLCPLLKRQVY